MTRSPFVAAFLLAGLLALPVLAASPDASPAVSAKAEAEAASGDANQTISFEQYRDWRLAYMDRRRSELAVQLAAADLTPQRKSRLEQTKAYYDGDVSLYVPNHNI